MIIGDFFERQHARVELSSRDCGGSDKAGRSFGIRVVGPGCYRSNAEPAYVVVAISDARVLV